MAARNYNLSYYGDERDDDNKMNSEEFLRLFRMDTRDDAADAKRLAAVSDHFPTRSPARKWFTAKQAGATPIATWANFEKEFLGEFPTADEAEPSTQEYEQRLAEMRITLEELGKTVNVGGFDVLTHMRFADQLLVAARKAKLLKGSSYIYIVRKELPEPLRRHIPASVATWEDFVAKIKAVDRVTLTEEAEESRDKKAKEAEMEARLGAQERASAAARKPVMPTTPVSKMAAQLGAAALSSPRATRAPFAGAGRDIFGGGAAGGRGNLFKPADLDEAGIRALRELVDKLQLPPDTRPGRDFYALLMRTWNAQYGGPSRPPLEGIGHPLSPGTVKPGSGECFRCGQLSAPPHSRDRCPGDEIPRNESAFRAICNKYLRAPRVTQRAPERAPERAGSVPMNFLDLTMPGTSVDEEENQDFGLGSSA
jgi:hypothetical protein